MSLFACVECGSLENTALCGLVFEEDDRTRRLVCSACNPQLGRWHGVFERKPAEPEYEPIPGSRYVTLAAK